MKYDFKFNICSQNHEKLDEVIKWCYESFDISLDYDTWQRKIIADNVVIHMSINYNELRWTYIIRRDMITLTILFRDEIDATAFKLRWI